MTALQDINWAAVCYEDPHSAI